MFTLQFRVILSFVLFSLVLTSCVDDEVPVSNLEFANVDLVVRGVYDGEPFVRNRSYSYNNGYTLRFSEFNMLVSELTARLNENETFSLDEVEYINLALFEGQAAAEAGFRVNIGRAPIGVYGGFAFGIGLTPEFNSTTPDDYGQNHPLGVSERYDAELNGFKFLNIIGEVDYDSDGSFDAPFNFTIGFDENYEVVSSTRSFEIVPEITNNVDVEVDLRTILDNGLRSVDFLDQLSTTPNPSDEIMLLLKSNIGNAITVN